jgi:hypothetical protein
MGAPAVVVRHDGFVRRDKLWRGAGLALPVFAARTRNSVGVGEFLDLMQLVDLADTAGMRLLQVRHCLTLVLVFRWVSHVSHGSCQHPVECATDGGFVLGAVVQPVECAGTAGMCMPVAVRSDFACVVMLRTTYSRQYTGNPVRCSSHWQDGGQNF